MSLDLSSPRSVLPLPVEHRPGATATAAAAGGATRGSRPAIQLKLSEDVLAHLTDLARKGLGGGMRITLGDAPAFVVNGVSYPLNLSPEPPHSELIRIDRARNLEPIAAVSHKASLKPGLNKGALEKVSLSLRGNREQAEREREGKRVVVLDSAPSSRSNSHSRQLPTATSAKRTLSPAGSGSRAASPAAPFQRAPSRLSAVPPKPARPPTSSFRIGKGTVPASLSMSRGNSSEGNAKDPTGSGSGASTGPAPSPATSVSTPPSPAVAAVSDAQLNNEHAAAGASASPPALPTAISPARQDSSSSTSTSSNDSSVHKSSSTLTSQSSGRSPLSVASGLPAHPASARLPQKPSVAAPPATVAARGGVMKGKGTLKKEKKQGERAKGKVQSAPIITESDDDDDDDNAPLANATASTSALPPPPPPTKSVSRSPETTKVNLDTAPARPDSPVVAPTVPAPAAARVFPKAVQLPSFTKRASTSDLRDDSDGGNSAAAKKRRKLLGGAGGADDEPSSRVTSRAPTPAGPRQSTGMHKSTSSASSIGTGSANGGAKKRPRKEERWYSSSDDDDDAVPERPPGSTKDRDKKSRRSSFGGGAAPSARSGSEAEDSRGRPAARVPSHLQPHDVKSKTSSPLRSSIVVVSRPISVPAPAPAPAAVESAPPAATAAPKKSPSSEYHITDATMYEAYRTRFDAAYGPYADLHKRLMRERDVCLGGGGREEFDVDEVEKLVKRIAKERAALAGIQEAIADWVERASR